MSDGRKVRLIDTGNAGQFIEVELNDDAAMSLADAQALIDAAQAENGAEAQWKTDDVITSVIVQCPDLFNQYFDNQNQAPQE